MKIDEIERRIGKKLFDHQREAVEAAPQVERALLHYKTGSGKTITGLSMMATRQHRQVVVITPPSTYDGWRLAAQKLGMNVLLMSHAKFRMSDTRVSRSIPIIVDEFHLLGGHKGAGWKKMDRLAAHLQAPLVIMSATPNYNDAERVYCIQHVLDPHSCKGGYIEFIYAHCETEQNPFAREPKVLGFRNYTGDDAAAQYLASLPGVFYLPDDLVYSIEDITISRRVPREMRDYGLNERRDRIIASQMEEKHAVIDLSLVHDNGYIQPNVYAELVPLIRQHKKVLIFAQHSTVAEALERRLSGWRALKFSIVTGTTPEKKKAARIAAFRDGVLDVLIGTATLATGTDGLDKVCDTLIILDDTEDDSLRRQLVGRIMPRGEDTDTSMKQVYRLVLQ